MTARRLAASEIAKGTALARRVAAATSAAGVSFEHDGERVRAFEGEPLAIALLAADRLVLSRSPKLHRPRGATCLRGHCEGCLVRVDDEPNVMACRALARGGESLRSQNAFPNAALDVFSVTDWFFPRGMDHHHLFVGAGRAVNETMQYFARKMSGLGTLPEAPRAFAEARRLRVDALVVGAGASGVAAANALCRKGFDVALADVSPRVGGSRLDDPTDAGEPDAPDARVRLRLGAAAVACFDDSTLLEDAEGVLEVRARVRVFATGTHDVVGAFAGNDLPGVLTARAFCRALCHGALAGERVVVAGEGPWSRRAREALAQVAGARCEAASPASLAALGSRRVERVVTSADGSEARCDALVVEGTAAASYELAGQAGAALRWSEARACFEPACDDDGATDAPGVFVCGSLRLGGASLEARAADGARVGARAAEHLAGGSAR
ncbi:MAG: (2Fe-2S)-binding protein [Polyangiales bacterium]